MRRPNAKPWSGGGCRRCSRSARRRAAARQTLLAAFGEAADPCGNCDICEGRWGFFDGSIAAQKMMSAVLRTAGRFHPSHLANLLIGKATEAIRRHGHDDLPTFGIGREMDAGTWRSLFRQILAAGLIESDAEDRDRWVVTTAGRAVLKGEATIPLRGERGEVETGEDDAESEAGEREDLTQEAAGEGGEGGPGEDGDEDPIEGVEAGEGAVEVGGGGGHGVVRGVGGVVRLAGRGGR